MRPARLTIVLGLTAGLAGCATFPELDAAVSEAAKTAPSPVLADNRVLLAAAGTTLEIDTQETLQTQAAVLDARAAGLSGPVIPPDEADRIAAAAEDLRASAARVAPEG